MERFVSRLALFVARYAGKPAFLARELRELSGIAARAARTGKLGSMVTDPFWAHDSALEIMDGLALLDQQQRVMAYKILDQVAEDIDRGDYAAIREV